MFSFLFRFFYLWEIFLTKWEVLFKLLWALQKTLPFGMPRSRKVFNCLNFCALVDFVLVVSTKALSPGKVLHLENYVSLNGKPKGESIWMSTCNTRLLLHSSPRSRMVCQTNKQTKNCFTVLDQMFTKPCHSLACLQKRETTDRGRQTEKKNKNKELLSCVFSFIQWFVGHISSVR